jgi:hypothetical protein
VIWVAVLKLVALSYATYESARARLYSGLGALATALYLTIARLASHLPPHPDLPLRDALARTWWLYPVAMLVLSLGPMLFAFRAAGALGEGDPRHERLERAGFAFLANVLLDAAVLVIVAIALLLVARDP